MLTFLHTESAQFKIPKKPARPVAKVNMFKVKYTGCRNILGLLINYNQG